MNRQISLDIFRGITLAAMLLVNNPGSWSFVYPPLLHAKWHGLTPTDLIFPFFLFIVGAAMFHSMGRYLPKANQALQVPWQKIAKRTIVLFAIGFLLNIFPFTGDPQNWRIMGVLQRIAICYGMAAILICVLHQKQLIAACITLLIGYWLMLNLVENPYGLETNLVRLIDIEVLGSAHLYQGFGVAFDPEGLLSCIPAVVTVLAGFFTSKMLANAKTEQQRMKTLLLWSLVTFVVCIAWQFSFPVNKSLWTSTYVLATNGFAWLALAVIKYLHDVKKQTFGFEWAKIYGSNPLFIYVLSWLFASTISLISWTNAQGREISVHGFLYSGLTEIMSPRNASLVFAIAFVFLFYLLSAWLYKRKIFIKI